MTISRTHGVSGQPSMMCSVCRHPLNGRQNVETGRYEHIHPLGHECGQVFIPVPVDPETVLGVCDFCNTPVPAHGHLVRCEPFAWTLATQDNRPVTDPHFDDGQWAACDMCADLIRAGQWDELTEHSMWVFEHVHGKLPPEARAEFFGTLRALHAPIRDHYIGIEEA